MPRTFAFDLAAYASVVNARLELRMRDLLPQGAPPRLLEAMRYSLEGGGKRFRPLLFVATLDSLGKEGLRYLDVGVAMEMAHTYSLIHDDLPTMDNDDYRRGRPTNHKVFGEAMAILAGDALLTEAFRILAELPLRLTEFPPALALELVAGFARALGAEGMVKGQVLDLEGEGKDLPLEGVEEIHRHKTGAFLRYAVWAAVRIARPPLEVESALLRYAERLGLLFQVQDDILDSVGDVATLGKTPGKDAAQRKATYVTVLGLEEAQRLRDLILREATEALAPLGEDAFRLEALARFVASRDR
ncbi:MAG: polyprenyl synthetase family protein [Brockia lithotrophica]|nr:polyprenyl synthetase family protein [Brockia lithotrophica]